MSFSHRNDCPIGSPNTDESCNHEGFWRNTAWASARSGNLLSLEDHDVRCPENTALTHAEPDSLFNQWSGGYDFRYKYMCCRVLTDAVVGHVFSYTYHPSWDGGNSPITGIYLDRQQIHCNRHNAIMKRFQM